MRTSRALLIPLLVLALASIARAQTPWEVDYGKIRDMERAKHWDDILTFTATMLGKYAEDRQFEDIYQWRGTSYESTQRWDALVAEAELLDKAAVGAKKPVLAKVLYGYAQRLHQHQKGDLAIRVYRLILEKCPGEAERCAWARLGVADCYLWHVKDAQPKALPELLAVERDYPKETAAVAAALQRIADYGGAMKDMRAAADACNRAIHDRKASFDPATLERFSFRRGEYLAGAQDWTGALAAYREGELSFAGSDATASDLAWRQATIAQEHLGPDPAILPLEHALASHGAVAGNICQEALRRLVDIHFQAKRWGEAAKLARIGLDTGDRDWCLAKLVECLKAIDPTNAKLVAFLHREMDGVKRPDGSDSEDVLADLGYPAWPEEIAKEFDKSLADLGDDWKSLRRKGIVSLYRGRPREAASFCYRAFLACPNPQDTAKIRVDLVEWAYHGVYDTHVGCERWQRFICPAAGQAPEEDIAALFKRELPARDGAAEVNDAIAALEHCLVRPYPVGVNPQDVAREREAYLEAYGRIAVEKGREDDLIRFCRSALEKDHLTGLYDNFVQTATVMCRMRDGNAAEMMKMLEELTDGGKTPAVVGQARGACHTVYNQLRQIHSPIVIQPQTYKRYLPPPPPKKPH